MAITRWPVDCDGSGWDEMQSAVLLLSYKKYELCMPPRRTSSKMHIIPVKEVVNRQGDYYSQWEPNSWQYSATWPDMVETVISVLLKAKVRNP